MAWIHKTENHVLYSKEETITLPSSTGTDYSSVIDFLDYALRNGHQGYIELRATASAVTGTNIDFALYGSYTEAGTKYALLDAPVADLGTSGTATTALGSVHLKAYPFPYYWIAHTVDTDEDANTVSYYITAGAASVMP